MQPSGGATARPRPDEAEEPAPAPAPSTAPAPAPAPSRARVLPRGGGLALVAAGLVVALAAGFWLVTGAIERLNPFRNGVVQQRTVDRSGPAVLKAVTDLGEFRAASGYYEVVIDVEKDVDYVPSFLAGERVLFVAAGSVDSAVDLRGLAPGAVTVNESRTSARIVLPRPRLTSPVVDVGRSYVYHRERGLVDRIREATGNDGDEKEFYQLASRRLAEAATATPELRSRGEANTRSMLEGLLRSLGFTDVTVTFA